VQGAEEAKTANVRMLVFTHIVPPLQNFVARRRFLSGVSDVFGGKVELGKDGVELSLPPSSTHIEVGSMG
jgi:ribonuclease Z